MTTERKYRMFREIFEMVRSWCNHCVGSMYNLSRNVLCSCELKVDNPTLCSWRVMFKDVSVFSSPPENAAITQNTGWVMNLGLRQSKWVLEKRWSKLGCTEWQRRWRSEARWGAIVICTFNSVYKKYLKYKRIEMNSSTGEDSYILYIPGAVLIWTHEISGVAVTEDT